MGEADRKTCRDRWSRKHRETRRKREAKIGRLRVREGEKRRGGLSKAREA